MLKAHSKGTSTAIVANGRLRVATAYPDGDEMVEEYDLKAERLLVRKWKRRNALGANKGWDFEINEDIVRPATQQDEIQAASAAGGGFMMRASSSEPILQPRDLKRAWEWRIRNLPYTLDTYSITLDEEKQQIVVRTTNKKYFKRIDVPALRRASIPLESSAIRYDHQYNTLIIQYSKPAAILAEEETKRKEIKESTELQKEGDVQCAHQ